MIAWLRRLTGCPHLSTIKEVIDGRLSWRCVDCMAYQPLDLELTEKRDRLETRIVLARLEAEDMHAERRRQAKEQQAAASTPMRRVK